MLLIQLWIKQTVFLRRDNFRIGEKEEKLVSGTTFHSLISLPNLLNYVIFTEVMI